MITLWRDLASVKALDRSHTYQAAVAEIEATGFLHGQSTVEVLALEEPCFGDAASGSDQP